MSEIKRKIDIFFIAIFFWLTALIPLGMVGWQVYGFLRNGTWISMSMLEPFKWLNVKWAYAPTDWVGLHSVLGWIPLSVGAFLVLLALSLSMRQEYSEKYGQH